MVRTQTTGLFIEKFPLKLTGLSTLYEKIASRNALFPIYTITAQARVGKIIYFSRSEAEGEQAEIDERTRVVRNPSVAT